MVRRTVPLLLALGVALSIASSVGAAGEVVQPGILRADPTYEHIGLVWFVEGDTDLDSTMNLEFRSIGETVWRPAAPAMRADPSVTVDGAPLAINGWGASAMFLTPGTTYELRATLTDPDGGGVTQTVIASTRLPPTPGALIRYVVPGNGGGSGTQADPWRGLQAAADVAQPGETIRVAPGTYAPFVIERSGTAGAPISLVGPADGSAVVEGGGTDRGVVTVGTFDRPTSHVIVDGLTIRNGRWGIDAQNTQDIVISRNTIKDVDYGVLNRRDKDLERNQTVCDNLITGRTGWPGVGIPSERGIDLRGSGNVVCHNQVQYFGDCISVQPFTGPSFGNDVYGNDVSYCVDDGIEVDYNQANVRVWHNRVMNARMGVSVQPIRGGPAYIFRNELFNLESNTIKLNNQPAGLYVVHNTGVKIGNGLGDGSEWKNAVFRNNLFLGSRYAFEFTTATEEGFRDFDFNAWGTSIGGESPWFKWDNVRYERLADLPAGVEDHGVESGFSDLVAAGLPASWDVAVPPGSRDLRPVSGAPMIDAGTHLLNLNDVASLAGQPDIGAFESGQLLPSYGPRLLETTTFADVPTTHGFFAEVEWLAAAGITRGCGGGRFCPDQAVTRGEMAAFLVRAMGYADDGGGDLFVDDDGSIFEGDIDRLGTAGVTRGCGGSRFCPDQAVTRGEMAAFLVRAMGYADDGGGDLFVDDDGSIFEGDIDRLGTAGVTRGCGGSRFCPDQAVTRGEMAAFQYRALG